ncbi:hypothetical protein C1632_10150 [Microbacterium testaceum]|nr:hypothetical protein C1632_10150 [Microbacterium testaceum]
MTHAGESRTSYCGPFLPHVGGAAATAETKIPTELEASGLYASWDSSFEDVLIGPDGSDCEIWATR